MGLKRYSTLDRAFTLHAVVPGSIPGSPYDPPSPPGEIPNTIRCGQIQNVLKMHCSCAQQKLIKWHIGVGVILFNNDKIKVFSIFVPEVNIAIKRQCRMI